MTEDYLHLGIYSDWVGEAHRQQSLYPLAEPGPQTQNRVREVLGFCSQTEDPLDVRVENRWQENGLACEEVSWSVGYGPRTHAYIFKPIEAIEPLPGMVALHDHGAFKFYGKEKIADGPGVTSQVLEDYRQAYYGGRAFANALAQKGFVVIVHDTFLWGSRRFPLETMMETVSDETAALLALRPVPESNSPEIIKYNTAASFHEHLVSKYCNLLGTSLAGVVSHEDRIATNYLLSRPDVDANRVGCLGLSGGGNRAALLNATHDSIRASVIIGLMTTYEGLLDRHVLPHTWMLFPFGWARYGDWPDLAACRAPSPLLVQYDLQDFLFTEAGMRAAHDRLRGHYESTGYPENYVGQFYPGSHKFDMEMQEAAFAWLKEVFY
jgi:dienelactone hydrolase